MTKQEKYLKQIKDELDKVFTYKAYMKEELVKAKMLISRGREYKFKKKRFGDGSRDRIFVIKLSNGQYRGFDGWSDGDLQPTKLNKKHL